MRRLFTLREPPPPLIKRLVGLVGVGLAVLVWFLVTLGSTPETRLVSPVVLPSPGEVLRSIPTLFTERAPLRIRVLLAWAMDSKHSAGSATSG